MAVETHLIDGKKIAGEIEGRLREEIEKFREEKGSVPGLLSLVVGDDRESHKFIRLKEQAAQRVGINFIKKCYPAGFDPGKVVEYIKEQNANPLVHGILVQLPLPLHFDTVKILKTIHPYKDVDALHPKNLGLLVQNQPIFISPVIRAILCVLGRAHHLLAGESPAVPFHLESIGEMGQLPSPEEVAFLRGARVVIVGGGLLVGKPLAIYLMNTGATVTVANRHTQNLPAVTRQAKILVSATGQKNLIGAEHVSEGAVVIDAARDVSRALVTGKAAVLSPSPGGVGPLTIAYLLANTVISWKRAR